MIAVLNRGDDVKWVFCCHRGKYSGLCGRFYDCIAHRDVEMTLSESRDLFMLAGFQLLEIASTMTDNAIY